MSTPNTSKNVKQPEASSRQQQQQVPVMTASATKPHHGAQSRRPEFWSHPYERSVKLFPRIGSKTSILDRPLAFLSGFTNPFLGMKAAAMSRSKRFRQWEKAHPTTAQYLRDNVAFLPPIPSRAWSTGGLYTHSEISSDEMSRLANMEAKPIAIVQTSKPESEYQSPYYDYLPNAVVIPNNTGLPDPYVGKIDQTYSRKITPHEIRHPLTSVVSPEATRDGYVNYRPNAYDDLLLPPDIPHPDNRSAYGNYTSEASAAQLGYFQRFVNRHGFIPKTFSDAVIYDMLTGHIIPHYNKTYYGAVRERGIPRDYSYFADQSVSNGGLNAYRFANHYLSESAAGRSPAPLAYKLVDPSDAIADIYSRAVSENALKDLEQYWPVE